jgi:3-oxoadipate enol-lactonase
MRRELATVGRKQIGYLISDNAAAKTRRHPIRTVLFLHAFPLSAEMWSSTIDALPDGWRGVAPDLHGFGRSSMSDGGEHGMNAFAGDVVDLLDHLEIGNAAVVGCSMGGYVAFELWKSAGHYVSGLLLVSTRANADTDEGRAGRLKMIELVDRQGSSAVAEQMVPKLLGATTQRDRKDLVDHVRHLIVSNSAEAIRTAVAAMMNRRDFTPFLGGVDVPAAVIAGAEDTLIPLTASQSMHGAIKGATLEVIDLAGHLPNLEQPDRFHASLRGFLQKL